MIILPTEKKIDWQHPPFVLIALVLINVLVFVIYQSSDFGKVEQAAKLYQQHKLVEIEKDLYLKYLQDKNFDLEQPDAYTGFESLIATDPQYLIGMFMQDRGFYQYLIDNKELWQADFKPKTIANWQSQRAEINDIIASTSAIAAGLIPAERNFWTFVSHQFLHGGFMHLFGNMVFLIICGFAVEAALGHLRFLAFYLLSGISGGLLFAAIDLYAGQGNQPLVGASGAISGVMAMYLVLFRMQKIEFFYWLFVLVGYFRAPALVILPFYIGNELINFWQNDLSNVAYMAHTGGFLAGSLLVGFTLLQQPDAIDQDYLKEDQEQNPEQQSLDKIYQLIESYQFKNALTKIGKHQSEFGESTITSQLQYQLLTTQSKQQAELEKLKLKILTQSDRDNQAIQSQLTIWRALNNEQKHQLEQHMQDKHFVQLALHFCDLDQFVEAEKIAERLIHNNSAELMQAKLFKNLAAFYHNNGGKQNFYQQQMQILLTNAQQAQTQLSGGQA